MSQIPPDKSAKATKTGKTQARLLALQVLQQVLADGASLTDVLQRLQSKTDGVNLAMVQAWCFGVLRDYWRLDLVLEKLLTKPLRERDDDVYLLLLLGLHQLRAARAAEHVIVNETVAVTESLKKPWAKGLVNAVLRNYLRQHESLHAELLSNPLYQSAWPAWLVERVQQDWPTQAQTVFDVWRIQAPMTLRVNTRLLSVADYQMQLAQANISAQQHPHVASALVLAQPIDVEQLPGFQQGFVSVQDAAAQHAAVLLNPQAGDRVLDACAAPGGKTLHLLDQQAELAELWALDIDAQRLQRVQTNLARYGEHAAKIHLRAADVNQISSWWDGQLFDRILLDVPCSGTGVIRRHPDIAHLRRASDIQDLQLRQQTLLRALWPLLKVGGSLLYVTCSILKAENENQIADFLQQESSASLIPFELSNGLARPQGWQLLPSQGDAGEMDGFYYALLCKKN
ncbi:MAG: 16S rRNA (cytosine(967)-C(5))-methyltransferase RsmB [Gammaproteobacteria bacterium]|nr:16S rRNA (cytosine(967)-C(5))-methyltransferase RsmB [Gammaproteobacteria bacterium]